MFPFKHRHSLIDSHLVEGLTDYHSHILPGVDDGVKHLNDSLAILKEYERLGLRKIYFTPHIMEDYPNNQPVTLMEKFSSFKKQYDGSIEIYLAGEHMLDYAFWHSIKEKNVLTIDSNKVLVEFPFINGLINIEEHLIKIQEAGYQVILAHPERYLFLDKATIQKLKSRNILFQLNLFSLVGVYNSNIKNRAQELLNKNYYNYIGSDIHSYQSFFDCIKIKSFSSKQITQLEQLKQHSL